MGRSCSTQSCQSYSWMLLPVQFSEIAKNWVDVDLRRPLSAVLHRVSSVSHSSLQRFSRNGLVFTGFNAELVKFAVRFHQYDHDRSIFNVHLRNFSTLQDSDKQS